MIASGDHHERTAEVKLVKMRQQPLHQLKVDDRRSACHRRGGHNAMT